MRGEAFPLYLGTWLLWEGRRRWVLFRKIVTKFTVLLPRLLAFLLFGLARLAREGAPAASRGAATEGSGLCVIVGHTRVGTTGATVEGWYEVVIGCCA
jgi:hypothetical protein